MLTGMVLLSMRTRNQFNLEDNINKCVTEAKNEIFILLEVQISNGKKKA